MRRTLFVVTLVALVLLGATGCRRVRMADPPSASDEASVWLGGAERAQVELRFGAGTLQVGTKPTSGKLMEATFDAVPSKWLPDVGYKVDAGVGRLNVTQPSGGGFMVAEYQNEWDVVLAEDVPMTLEVDAGAGECRLDLGGSRISDLDVEAGAGELEVDLSGEWSDDLDAEIKGGIGEITLRVPRDVGVRIHSLSGLGTVSAEGFLIDDGAYVNDEYGQSPVTLDIDLQQGLGDVTLLLVD